MAANSRERSLICLFVDVAKHAEDVNAGERFSFFTYARVDPCQHVWVCACLWTCVCVCVCACLAVEIMFSMSPSVQERKQATVPRVSCSIRLVQKIDCKRVVVSIGKCHWLRRRVSVLAPNLITHELMQSALRQLLQIGINVPTGRAGMKRWR